MKKSTWLWFAAFAVAYLALRVFWLSGDPGIPSLWEYGYNATDEGYYLSGGKEKLLWGCFVDLARTEVFTYGFSSGTNWLSYLAHLLFGLSTWTWRIPFFAITCLAWFVAYVYLSRRSTPLNGFLLCLAFSSIPMLIAYERTASNDVLIGSLTVMAYVLATGKSKVRLIASAIVASLIVLVKPSVWVLLPVVLAGVLNGRRYKHVWIDALVFLTVAIGGVFVWRLMVALAVTPDSQRAGVSIWMIVKRTTTHYPLPNILDFASHFKGLSAFPRDPSYTMMGVTTVFVFVLPAIMALRMVFTRRFNGNTLLFFAIPAYVAAINVMNTQYTHYFIPAMMMIPFVIDSAREELSVETSGSTETRRILLTVAFVVAACAVGLLFMASTNLSPRIAQAYYSRIYNFPSENVWGMTIPYMAAFAVFVLAVLSFLNGVKGLKSSVPVWIASSFVVSTVAFAALPSIALSSHIRQSVEHYFAPMAVVLTVSTVLLVCIEGLSEKIHWGKTLVPFAAISVLLCYSATPTWRNAARELLAPPTHHHEAAAKELASLLPSDAIVIGERSNQMLMSLPIRTATTFAANSDPIPVIKSILQAEPNAKLYALADSQHAYNLQHYREHKDEYRLDLIKTFKMPSFGDGKLADVYLCRIVDLRKKTVK